MVTFTKEILMENFIFFSQYHANILLQGCFEINGVLNRVYLPMGCEESSPRSI